MDLPLQSPYCNKFKLDTQNKGIIIQRMIVRKLTRRELEDKYLRLIDESYDLKRENNDQKEKIKVLTTKLLRSSKENNKFKSREFLLMNEISHENDEYFHPSRPASSAIIRNITRNSTPNSALRYKGNFLVQENDPFLDDILKHPHSCSSINDENQKSQESTNRNSFNNASSEIENKIEKLTLEIKKLQNIGELEKTNESLKAQIEDLQDKLKTQDVNTKSKSNAEITILTEKTKELQAYIDEFEQKYHKRIEEISQKAYEEQKKSESLQKIIDELSERVAIVEKEKTAVISKYEQHSNMTSNKFDICKKQLCETNENLKAKEKELEKERHERASIEHSQGELLRKMKELQRENDHLVVKLEGLGTENEDLITKNKELECRLMVLEDQNKQHLEEINETLKVPSTKLQFDDISKIENSFTINKQLSQNNKFEKPSRQLSVSFTSSNTHTHDDQINDNTHNSQDICAPSHSPGPNFAEFFSRSVSKDLPSADDDFDPNTFSIDQISDMSDPVSELIEDDQTLNPVKF